MRITILAAALLIPTLAHAEPLLFPDRAASYVRATHPELAHAPLAFTCVGPTRTTEWRSEPTVAGPRDPVSQRRLIDARCDYPWNHAQSAIAGDPNPPKAKALGHKHKKEAAL